MQSRIVFDDDHGSSSKPGWTPARPIPARTAVTPAMMPVAYLAAGGVMCWWLGFSFASPLTLIAVLFWPLVLSFEVALLMLKVVIVVCLTMGTMTFLVFLTRRGVQTVQDGLHRFRGLHRF